MNGKVTILQGDKAARLHDRLSVLSQRISFDNQVSGEKSKAYQKAFVRKNNIGRVKAYIYFALNFHKYQKRYLLQQAKHTARSRVEDLLAAVQG